MPKIGDLIVASLNDYVSLWRIHEFPPHILNAKKKIVIDFNHQKQPPNGESDLLENARYAIH